MLVKIHRLQHNKIYFNSNPVELSKFLTCFVLNGTVIVVKKNKKCKNKKNAHEEQKKKNPRLKIILKSPFVMKIKTTTK